MWPYLRGLLVAFDYAVNALLAGVPNETLSSRAHRMRAKRQPYWWWLAGMIDGLWRWQPNHSERAYRHERGSTLPMVQQAVVVIFSESDMQRHFDAAVDARDARSGDVQPIDPYRVD